jgi:hypothetical protein
MEYFINQVTRELHPTNSGNKNPWQTRDITKAADPDHFLPV